MEPTTGEIDVYTKRLRQPNDQYTVLTDTQIQNNRKHPSMHFHFSQPKVVPDKRWWVPRYCNHFSQHLVREVSRNQPYCWLDYQWDQNPHPDQTSCRQGAFEKWGPKRNGEKTYRHFDGEPTRSFLNIDVYRPPARCEYGPTVMDCGRPGVGYHQQKYASQSTWFGSSVPLNRTDILQTINRKTTAEYKALQRQEQIDTQRVDQWPEYSEYTDKFIMKTKPSPRLNNLEERKRFLAESRHQEEIERAKLEESWRQSQILPTPKEMEFTPYETNVEPVKVGIYPHLPEITKTPGAPLTDIYV
ncbi:uncharacterized protein LOC106169410 [Lingula anatina]|uniref:Uncharacterized protein LOC106157403 n=1 Tax=Lingula anatina TaxID=7574 RepID=A0A1S3HR26_LINAN|nr:uncharacterized protein LOC106157403 [Lingula anatina]XP_013404321.1 uncharacterized protein LOC106169410 [Lingula anatina]|eukprot:XP_013388490.1 uncharacterized protein LOC106157403 [Lingula anatina]